jgi:hypothetical protein
MLDVADEQNLDLEDINVRNAQFKSFDTIVRMRLKPVWHKVGAKTRIHVAALTELRNLHTYVHITVEYRNWPEGGYSNTILRLSPHTSTLYNDSTLRLRKCRSDQVDMFTIGSMPKQPPR